MTYLLHLSNVLYLAAFVVKDILWLRVLSIAGGTFAIVMYFFRTPPMYDAAGWDMLFVAINVIQITRLIAERRPARLDEREQRLYQLLFRSLTPREFKKLVALGAWESFKGGEHIVERGKELSRVRVMLEGEVEVRADDRIICRLGPGQFVGEMAYLSSETPTTDVFAADAVTFLALPSEKLREFLEDQIELRAQIQAIVGADLVRKLRLPVAS